MKMKAVFVGIDRHRSPDIPELSGAKRDATALWTLFTDSVPGLASRLLVDEQATLSEVRDVVFGTLDSAGPDDIVILSFAGHCSPDGSLVLYDTEPTDLAGKALSMTVLAEAFRTTKAKVGMVAMGPIGNVALLYVVVTHPTLLGSAVGWAAEQIGSPRSLSSWHRIS